MVTRHESGAQLVSLELTAGASAQLGLLLLLSVGVGLSPAAWLAGTAYAAVTLTLLTSALRRSRMRSLGPANHVTLARAMLVGGVTALVTGAFEKQAHVGVLVAVAAVALVLDAVDGQVARRTGTTSSLGARFDMEVDAFLILVLSIFVATSLGAWVLTIGAMRYLFVAAAWVMRWLRSPLPPSLARKAVAALQGIVLTVASAGVIPRSVAIAAVLLSLALLAWSFGRDIMWLWRDGRRHTISSA